MNFLKEKLVDLCIILTITLAMFLGLELAVRVARQVKVAFFPAPEAPSTILKQPWGRQYQLDEERLSYRHVDYVEFRETPYRSETINVDEEGRRQVPGNCERADAFTIWMFGGSTMFGYGAPDEFTIPAYLAKFLNGDGRCTKIINFGAGNWQSSQELIQLIEVLKRSKRPHAVIFYDGVNDSLEEEVSPGAIDPSVHALLNQAFLGDNISIFTRVARSSALVSSISSRISRIRENFRKDVRLVVPSNFPEHARAMAAIYAQNVRIVDLLAREYGFRPYFYLQPYPSITEKKLTPMEGKVIEGSLSDSGQLGRENARASYRAFRENAFLKSHPGYVDISGIFDGLTDELFADDAHLLPEGNRIVAERIARDIVLPSVAK